MNILELLGIRKRKTIKDLTQEDVLLDEGKLVGEVDVLKQETQKDIKTEQIEKEKIRKKLMTKEYNGLYLFTGHCEKSIEVDGKVITYDHKDVFLANSKYTSEITKVVRLTGDNLSGKPISISRRRFFETKTHSGYWNYFYDEGQEYWLSSNNFSDNREGFIMGSLLDRKAREYNEFSIKYELKKIAEKNEVDEMFNE